MLAAVAAAAAVGTTWLLRRSDVGRDILVEAPDRTSCRTLAVLVGGGRSLGRREEQWVAAVVLDDT